MTAITFPTTSSPSRYPGESRGRLINVLAEKKGDSIRWLSSPGHVVAGIAGNLGPRGFVVVGGAILAAYRDVLVRFDAGFTAETSATLLGSLPGEGRVTFAANNRVPTPDVLAVSENGVYRLSLYGAPTLLSEGDLPAPVDIVFQDGYFFLPIGDGRCFATALNDVTVDANAFIRAEARADGLLRGIAFKGLLFLFGQASTEIWQDTAQEPPAFPYSRAEVIPRGLIGSWAIAGFEEGWSNELIWVGDDAVVYQLVGYQAQRVSTHDIERQIEAVADKTTLEASVYMTAGHAFWELSSPDWTWVYDLTTQEWHERASYGANRCRASGSVKFAGSWYRGDTFSGYLMRVDERARGETDLPLVATLESVPSAAFPNRLAIPRANFSFVTGQADAEVEVSWSDDGGATWSNPLLRSLGPAGSYARRVEVWRTGMTGQTGRIWRLRLSDAAPFVFLGGDMTVQAKAA